MLEYMLCTFATYPFSRETIRRNLKEYLKQQIGWCDDPTFSASYPYEKLSLPQHFFQQRIVYCEGVKYLTGPRFVGGDIKRPFIELVASSGAITRQATEAILDIWRPLGSSCLRILRLAGKNAFGEKDQLIYSRGLEQGGTSEIETNPSCTLALAAPSDFRWCVAAVLEAYQDTYVKFPELRGQIAPASESDIRESILSNEAFIISHEGDRAGFFICESGKRAFLSGNWITEEVIIPKFRGLRLAANGQLELLRLLEKSQRHGVLIGTIDSTNLPSIRAAERAGRRLTHEYVFVSENDFNDPD